MTSRGPLMAPARRRMSGRSDSGKDATGNQLKLIRVSVAVWPISSLVEMGLNQEVLAIMVNR